MIVIRSMQRDDVVPAIQLLIGGALGATVEDPCREAEYWEAVQDIVASGGTVLVADDDGEVVGMCQVFTFRHFQHVGGRAAEVESVHVRVDRRSQGIGEQLMGAAEEFARQQGCYRVQLTSNNQRLDAYRFYVRLGYDQSHQGFKKLLNR
jgi:GNAT superfamily N-acetyltransferase